MSMQRLAIIAAVSHSHLGGHHHSNNKTSVQHLNASTTTAAGFYQQQTTSSYYNFPLNANLVGGTGSSSGNSNVGLLFHQGQHNSMRSGLGSNNSSLHGNVNILLGGAMLSVVITILCVVCYCCHRNIKKRTESAYRQRWLENDANMEIYSVEQCYETSGLFMDSDEALANQLPTLSYQPPPSYDTVVAMDEMMNRRISPPPGYRSTASITISNNGKTIEIPTSQIQSTSQPQTLISKYQLRSQRNFNKRSSQDKNYHFRMLRTESCCSLERALGGCTTSMLDSSNSSSDSNGSIIGGENIPSRNIINTRALISSYNEACPLCGKLQIEINGNTSNNKYNESAEHMQHHQQHSNKTSSIDSGFENLINVDHQQNVSSEENSANTLSISSPSNSVEACGCYSNGNQISSETSTTLTSLTVPSTSFTSSSGRSSNNDGALCLALDDVSNGNDIKNENGQIRKCNDNENISNIPIMDLNLINCDGNENYKNNNNNNNNESLEEIFVQARGTSAESIESMQDTDNCNSNTNLNYNRNENCNNNNATLNLECINDNGIIRLDMSQIIDRTGLPTYEAAIKLETSGYV